eukprot:1137719-Prymnesium_polylepis.3
MNTGPRRWCASTCPPRCASCGCQEVPIGKVGPARAEEDERIVLFGREALGGIDGALDLCRL